MRVILVGNSPLALYTARLLDTELARDAHTRVVWLTTEAELYHPTFYNFFHPNNLVPVKELLSHVEVIHEDVKSINIANRQVVTGKQVLDFDVLCVDATPWYLVKDLRIISQSAQKLFTHLRLKKAAGAAIRFKGNNPLVWQVALSMQNQLRTVGERSVRVEIDSPRHAHIDRFIKDAGVQLKLGNLPGFTVAEPEATVSLRKVKGIRLDRSGAAIVDAQLRAARNCLVVSATQPVYQLTMKALSAQAEQVAWQIEHLTYDKPLRTLPAPKPSFVLQSGSAAVAVVGDKPANSLAARIFLTFERKYWRALLGRRHR